MFCGMGGQSVQGAMLVYPKGSCGNTVCCLFAHLLVCISQAGLEPASGSMGVLLFSHYNVGVLGVEVLLLLVGFFLPSMAPASQQEFYLWSSHCLLPLSSHHFGFLLNSEFLIIYSIKYTINSNIITKKLILVVKNFLLYGN
jgi:hypothetical protein